ncbi:hypothetical protein ABK040_000992 [Willaertia magna]
MTLLVKEELTQLKEKYNLKVKSIKGQWPLEFNLKYIPEIDIKVDPLIDGFILKFQITQNYPNKDNNCKLLNIDIYRSTDKSITWPCIILDNILNTCKLHLQKIIKQYDKQIILRFMKYLENNITNIIINNNSEFIDNYITEGINGGSERRYQIDFTKFNKKIEEEIDDDEIPELNFYSLQYPNKEISENNGKDTLLCLQGVEMQNISMFEMKRLSFIVICDRCNSENDIKDILRGETKNRNCIKCSKEFTIEFIPYGMTSESFEGKKGNELIAGIPFIYLILENCQFFNLLSKNNIIEILCFNCSHSNELKEIKLKSVNEMNCLHCHQSLSLKIQNIQKRLVSEYLTMITHNSGSQSQLDKKDGKKNKKKSKLIKGITIGCPLPLFGTCSHYKNSKRWFIFDCCGKHYPCDICHENACDIAKQSPQMARKMICGYCSREQSIAYTCYYCKRNLTKKMKL